MSDSVLQFYDQLVNDYHFIFDDWRRSVVWQGEALDKIISNSIKRHASGVLLDIPGPGSPSYLALPILGSKSFPNVNWGNLGFI